MDDNSDAGDSGSPEERCAPPKNNIMVCTAKCSTLQCAAFRASPDFGDLATAFASLSKTERTTVSGRAIAAAIFWNSETREYEYTFNVNLHRVCLAAWAAAYNIPSATVYRKRREAEMAATAAREAHVVGVGSHLQGVVPRVGKLKPCCAEHIASRLRQYAESMGEKLPTPLTGARGCYMAGDHVCEIRLPHGKKEDVYEEYKHTAESMASTMGHIAISSAFGSVSLGISSAPS